MTNKEKALAIAQDVLVRLDAELLETSHNYYLSVRDASEGRRNRLQHFMEVDLGSRDLLKLVEESCRVCVLGACLLSKARLFSDVGVLGKYLYSQLPIFKDDVQENLVHELEGIFSIEQLHMIELAFEGRSVGTAVHLGELASPGITEEERRRAIDFCDEFNSTDDLSSTDGAVRKIMENIISNGGVFIP